MAVLPMGFISNIGDREPKTNAAPNSDYKRYISKAAEYCDNSFCGEALKAIAIIARTNCKSGAELPSEANDNSDSELYKRLEKIFNDGARCFAVRTNRSRYPFANALTVLPRRRKRMITCPLSRRLGMYSAPNRKRQVVFPE